MGCIARGSVEPPTISSIQSTSGSHTTDPQEVLNSFPSYYQELYSTHTTVSASDIVSYLSTLTLPALSDTEQDYLEGPITVQEVLESISSFQPAKSPGSAGLPIELYREYTDFLAPKLLEVYLAAFNNGGTTRVYA